MENNEMFDEMMNPPIDTEEETFEEVIEEPVTPAVKSYKVTGALVNLRKEATRQSKIMKAVIIDTILDITDTARNDEEDCTYGFIPAENAWINMNYVESI